MDERVGMQSGPSSEPKWVKVTAADYNPAIANPWDGCPFSSLPQWLVAALSAGKLQPHNHGGTDYAQWRVQTSNGVVNAKPDDFISLERDGSLHVTQHPENRRNP